MICDPKIPIEISANTVTVADILSVHLNSWRIVVIAASISKVGIGFNDDFVLLLLLAVGIIAALSEIVLVVKPSKAGKKACDNEDPTSPSIIQTIVTESKVV